MVSGLTVRPIASGVDWITVTQRPGPSAELLQAEAFALAEVELSQGGIGRPWRASGYEGFICGGVSFGERHDGCILQITGGLAASHWQRAYENAASVTRLDLQTTFRLSCDPREQVLKHYAEICAMRKTMKKPPEVRITGKNEEAFTVYTGAPQSARMGRIYDKQRESGLAHWDGCVRYELRLLKKVAKVGAFKLSEQKDPARWVALNCFGFFRKRGCCLQLFSDALKDSAFLNDLKCPASVTNLESTCSWLEKSVRPSVLLVAERLGREKVLSLLGLQDDVVECTDGYDVM